MRASAFLLPAWQPHPASFDQTTKTSQIKKPLSLLLHRANGTGQMESASDIQAVQQVHLFAVTHHRALCRQVVQQLN